MTDNVSDDDSSSHGRPLYAMDDEFLFMPCPPRPHTLVSSEEDAGVTDDDDQEPTDGTFDWRESTPGNGWTQRSLAEAFQQVSESPGEVCSQSSSLVPPAFESPRHQKMSLQVASIEAAACARCKCPPSMYCMSKFDIGVVFRLRYARSKLSKQAEMAARNSDLARAAQKTTKKCIIDVEGKDICLQAYCILFDINWSSMRRSWARLVNGQANQDMGRPRGSSGRSPGTTPRSQDAYAWLKQWIEVFGDLAPLATSTSTWSTTSCLPTSTRSTSGSFLLRACPGIFSPCPKGPSVAFGDCLSTRKRFESGARPTPPPNAEVRTLETIPPDTVWPQNCFCGLVAVCDELVMRSRDPKANREELARVREARITHHKEIIELRQLYINDTQRAKHDMTFQTIAFDGANSNTCNCPQTWRASVRGEATDGTFVPQKIQSVLFHGRALVFYVVPPFVKSGMDLAVSCLIDAMQYVDPRTRTLRFQYDGRLPTYMS